MAADPQPPDGPLSWREREVLRLVADGWPNRQITAAPVIGQRTGELDVTSTLNTLGADTRALAAVLAVRRGPF